jgi:tetraacyldisaccharide 4'-kinase
VPLADVADFVWYGDTATSRVARAALLPLSTAFSSVVARRNRQFDATPPEPGPIPAISIGNLTVGGTGKTPVSAWFARRLRDAGASPALVMRGYGDDEVLVHRVLNPDVPVFAGADRTAEVARAASRGADVAILDDAFQHRRAARVADVVLVSADRWTGEVLSLPAGPFREPMSGLRRAQLVLVTVKAASEAQVRATVAAVRAQTTSTVVTVDLMPASFATFGSAEQSALEEWRGRRVLAVSGIGDPVAFERQLRQLGLLPTVCAFADHQSYGLAAIARILRAAAGLDAVVCTLKDAVKLGDQWPGSAIPLWYLSQSVVPRDGTEALDDVVRSVLEARRITLSPPDLPR